MSRRHGWRGGHVRKGHAVVLRPNVLPRPAFIIVISIRFCLHVRRSTIQADNSSICTRDTSAIATECVCRHRTPHASTLAESVHLSREGLLHPANPAARGVALWKYLVEDQYLQLFYAGFFPRSCILTSETNLGAVMMPPCQAVTLPIGPPLNHAFAQRMI